ncbi:hypothetical protein LguiA_014460 [Lonicera macranthoides]
MDNLNNSGLLRFRSAPSSLFTDLLNDDVDKCPDDFSEGLGSSNLLDSSFEELISDDKQVRNNYNLNSQLPPDYPRQNSSSSSNLLRQSSSPAGLVSYIATAQNGYATMRGDGNYIVGNVDDGDLSPSSRMSKAQMKFFSGLPSSLGTLSRISETEAENVGDSESYNVKLENGNVDNQFYSEHPFGSWNNSLPLSENLSGSKKELNGDKKLSGAQKNRMPIFSHHLSLPKTSAEMEKLLQFQDSVPCKISAKRGYATHPRSIAERVRRTRISERMRKLQDLVPNMDKQTNTSDMLDLAVDYIKDLQKQFKSLSNNQTNCRCSNMLKPIPN